MKNFVKIIIENTTGGLREKIQKRLKTKHHRINIKNPNFDGGWIYKEYINVR